MPEERGLDGFVDGTENPHGDDEIASVGIIAEGKSAGAAMWCCNNTCTT